MTDMTKCYICREELDSSPGIHNPGVSIDDYGNVGRICAECNIELHGKIALVAENCGTRTGEVIFITRRAAARCHMQFASSHAIYIVTPVDLRSMVQCLIQMK
jgi:hypothetical protein